MRYLSHGQALEYVAREAGMSRETFDLNIRPRLVERKYSDRVSRFALVAIDAAIDNPAFQEEQSGVSMFGFQRKTLKDALEHTWDAEWSLQKGSKTQRYLIDVLIEETGDWALKRIDFNRIEGYVIERRKAGLAEATIARRLTAIMKALRVSKVKGWIDALPEKPAVSIAGNEVERYMAHDEEKLILAAARIHKSPIARRVMPRVIVILTDVGCRLSELTKCRPQDVHDDGAIFTDRKAGGRIKVPLTARARENLSELHRDDWWLSWTRNIHARDKLARDKALRNLKDWLVHRFTEITDAAKLPDITLHVLRHTTASRLVQAGFDLLKVRDWLGHKDIKQTQRYAHLAPSALAGGARLLEQGQSREGDNIVNLDERRIPKD